ncbi:MAG TPA: hypothetical protein VFT76_00325 [Actinomycetota bacterium]|nr:hypothetical protein [Actinomycetota bacterium]
MAPDKEEAMAEEITLEQEVDRILSMQATATVPDELVWEPEPFEDQRAYASVRPGDPAEPEDPDETEAGPEESDTNAGTSEIDEDEED